MSYFVGVILLLAGVCLLVNKKARTAAHVFRAYDSADGVMDLPAHAPGRATDVVALNFFFDTLLFCGAILLLANSIDKEPAVARS